MSFGGFADSTDVYCASIDGNVWDWLYKDDGTNKSVEGEWGIHWYDNTSGFSEGFRYFTVPLETYQEIQIECNKKGMFAQPANNRFSSWSVFQIEFNHEQKIFAPGYYTTINDPLMVH